MARNIQFAEGEYYHIYNRGVEKRRVFMDEKDHERFVRLLYSANSTESVHLSNYQGSALLEIPRGESLVDVGAWCLMPNHFHILLKEKRKGGLSKYLQKLLTGYTMYFNTKYHRKGILFEGPFNAKHLDNDNYLKYQYAYIHLNPLGIIDNGWKKKEIFDFSAAKNFLFYYSYSSFQDYRGIQRDMGVILNSKAFPEYFETFTDFESMIEEWIR
ncbi:MAG: Transposase [Parcubacteria group bacterium GW2011_GWF2_38_8]|nr:MAG: Transposase [Parcubacteria group bacterium GW2011_GWF2_38_8]